MAVPPQQRFDRLANLFQEAVSLPRADRDAFVSLSCGADTELREELDRLLASDWDVSQKASSAPSRLPRFGNYQARKLIGAGGMGAVYAATREDGEVNQQVAIKAIASGFVSPLLSERLRRERQFLAELHHPNIAAFLDGGMTDDGFPYLVMEYVEGECIDTWCDTRTLDIHGRLVLFQKVCAAVSFAHRRLIVHRDLKPGNILVTPDGEPKLLDFGVARTLTADSSTTATSNLFLTPLYSCPEALHDNSPAQPTTVSADVYSLGVLLYELLSGARPFGRPGATAVEMIESVLHSDPRPLGDAVTAEAAAKRRETPAGLVRQLRGDLEAVVCKAIAKSPEDRYDSVEQFSADIERHLAGHPVHAAAPNPIYKARKFVARHKGAVVASALVALSLIGGLTATLWQARIAERRFADAHELARYLVFDLQKSVGKLPGSTPIKAEMVRRSLEYLDRLSAEKIHDPALRTEVGEGYAELGAVLGSPFQPNLGQPAQSRDSDRKAIAILDSVAAADPNNRRARVVLARTRLELGRNLVFNGQASEGLGLIETATGECARIAKQWPGDFDVQETTAFAFDTLSRTLTQSDGYVNAQNLDRALDSLRIAIEHADLAMRLRPADFGAIRQLAMSDKQMGDLTELRDRSAATTFYRQGLAVLDRVPEKDRDLPDARNSRSSMLLGLGWNLGNLGDFDASLAYLEEARQIRDRIAEQDPQNMMALFFRTTPYRNLGIVSGLAGRDTAKLKYFLADIEIFDRLLARNPDNRGYRFSRAELQADAANLSAGLGQIQEANRLAREAIATLTEAANRPQASLPELAITARAVLDTRVPSLRDPKLALVFAKRAIDLNPKESEALEILAKAYWANGEPALAQQSMERALAEIGPESTPERKAYEKTLAAYRIAPNK